MKRSLTAILVLLLAGCASVKEFRADNMQNRLTMTTACDQVRSDSQWLGLFGVSAQIDPKDAKPVLDALCGARAAAPAASAASAPK